MDSLADAEIDRIEKCVAEKLEVAMSTRCKFSIQADSWKPKIRHNRRHYVAAMLSWISDEWKWQQVCCHVMELPRPRDTQCYKAFFEESLKRVSVSIKEFIICGVSDHEGAIRAGLRAAGVPQAGCSCHGIQLTARRALPPLKTKVQAAPLEGSDDSDSDDSSDTSSESDKEDIEVACKRLRCFEPETCDSLRKRLEEV